MARTVPEPEIGFETRRSRSALGEFYEMHERLDRAQRTRDGDLVFPRRRAANGTTRQFGPVFRIAERLD